MNSRSSPEIHRARPLLGTIVTVRAASGDPRDLRRGVDRAFNAIARVQALMSFHDPSSELSLLNGEAHRRMMRVSPHMWTVLRAARRLFLASGGLFDATVAPHLVRWGYLPGDSQALPRAAGTMADVEWHPDRTVRFARPLLVDLGGIAKGYAVDLAVRTLRRAGVRHGSVNAGGDLRVFGPASQIVHVRHPRLPQACVPLAEVTDSAMATSAMYFSRRRVRGRLVTPVVDPVRRVACRTASTVSVIAPTCLVADALTKVVLLAGEAAFPVVRRFSASAVIVTPEGRVVCSESSDRAA